MLVTLGVRAILQATRSGPKPKSSLQPQTIRRPVAYPVREHVHIGAWTRALGPCWWAPFMASRAAAR